MGKKVLKISVEEVQQQPLPMWSALVTLTRHEAMELLWFYLLLSYLTLSDTTSNSESCLLQRVNIIWRKVGKNVELPCAVNPECPGQPWKYEWFSFKEHSHIRLNLTKHPDKYKLAQANLHISSLQVDDSGIYHCAASSQGKPGRGAQHVGPGTTLVVKEQTKTNIYLWVIFTLLSAYSLAVVTLIVKKYGCRKIPQINKHNSTKKMHFRDVLQEMHGKKFRERCKAASSNSPQTEADDIYQNVKDRFEVADASETPGRNGK